VKKRFLITTADQSTWRFDEPVLFLGEWCKIYTKKDIWESLDSEVASYRWDDRQQLFEDFEYLVKLYERILPAVASKLNALHGTNFSERYWKIIVGPWLLLFIQIIFERFHQIAIVNNGYEISGTAVSACQADEMVPIDMFQFADFFVSDKWNHHIYSCIIRNSSKIPYTYYSVEKDSHYPKENINHRSFPRKVIDTVSGFFRRKTDITIVDYPLSLVDQFRLLFRHGYLVDSMPTCNLSGLRTNTSMRQWELDIPAGDTFEKFLVNLLPKQIPIVYLEGYHVMAEFCLGIPLGENPDSILSSYVTYNEEFKFWASQKIENGSKLFIGQHGGGYGIGKWFSNEVHELSIADGFFSWGWADRSAAIVRPMGMLKKTSFKTRNRFDQEHILLIVGSIPRYSYKLYSETVSKQWLNYFGDQRLFIQSLPQDLRNKLLVKLYPTDYGWNDESRFKDAFSDVCYESGNRSVDNLSGISRVIISTYNSTSFLETLSKNIPTIVYWDPVFWEIRESAQPFFDELKEIGVFHESPESAALQLAQVWDDVGDWWLSPKTQKTINKFVQTFCYTSPGLLTDVVKYLQRTTIEN
jgi:putative transferase (TIGR04331 family)